MTLPISYGLCYNNYDQTSEESDMAGFRIMVVEDEERMRQLLHLYMQNEGFEVVEASDGQQALELFEQYPMDLVILDVMLPHVDGWTVCRQIRQGSQVPIIDRKSVV